MNSRYYKVASLLEDLKIQINTVIWLLEKKTLFYFGELAIYQVNTLQYWLSLNHHGDNILMKNSYLPDKR